MNKLETLLGELGHTPDTEGGEKVTAFLSGLYSKIESKMQKDNQGCRYYAYLDVEEVFEEAGILTVAE